MTILLLCGMDLLTANVFAADQVLEASRQDHEPISLTKYFAILEDPSQKLTLEAVQKPDTASRFKTDQPDEAALNYGFTGSAYWLRLTLRNSSDQPIERMLEIGFGRISNVQFHRPVANGTYQSLTTGTAIPFASRPYKNRFFVFPITLPAHSEHVYYLRIQSTNPILVPARLWVPQEFHAHERSDYLGQAWYFGMATAMVIFNLLLFFALRDAIYFLYVLFVTSTALTLAARNGLAQEYLWPDATLWSDISNFVGFSLTIASFMLFMRHMLNTREVIPKLDRLLQYIIVVFLLCPFGIAVSLQTFAKPASLLNVTSAALIVGIGIFCAFKRQRSAYFFLTAFAMLVLGGVMTVLTSLKLLPANVLTVNGLQFGSAAEMLLLAFALADRFNRLRREKEKAQQQLVETLRSSERVLEERVEQRTTALTDANQQLEDLANTDVLTGLPNRRYALRRLAEEWVVSVRDDTPLACMMIDADGFKVINDTYGHDAGDAVLRTLSVQLRGSVRTDDLVCRLGGDEFLVICVQTPFEGAMKLAEAIRQETATLSVPAGSGEWRGSLSIGVAARTSAMTGLEDLLKAADQGVYVAKRNGRNCVGTVADIGPRS